MNEIFQLRALSFSYTKATVLQDIHLQLKRGMFYGLLGANGSGKSTLLEILSGGLKPSSGSVLFQAKEISRYSKQELATKIALVPQKFSMDFEYSVWEVVLMGRHPHIPRFSTPAENDHRAVERALTIMDIEYLRKRPVSGLSGGELQRVVMARALAQETEVLILDEATASLDIHHTIAIMRVIREMVNSNGLTVLAAIHDLNLAAAFCDNCIILQNGTVYTEESVNSVFTTDMLRTVFSVDATVNLDNDPGYPQIGFRYRN